MSENAITATTSTSSTEPEPWEIPVNNWNNLGSNTLLFIHEEAVKKINSTIEIYNSTTGRGVILLSIYTSIFGIAFGFIISKLGIQLSTTDERILGVAILSLLITTYTFVLVYRLIFPYKVYDIGHPPDKFNYEVLEKIEDHEKQHRLAVYNQMQTLQHHITCNEETNRTRWALYKRALRWTGWTLACSVILLILLFLICR